MTSQLAMRKSLFYADLMMLYQINGFSAQCTSAAPWFFPPKVLKNLGTYQDGGLHHNNPAKIAHRECQFLWPEKPRPDFMLSFGTGKSTTSDYRLGPQSPVTDRCLLRLKNLLMSYLDSEKAWVDFYSTLPMDWRPRYHRLNVEIIGPEPSIDDIASLDHLRQLAETSVACNREAVLVQDSIYASLFYFELENDPEFNDGAFQCYGSIFCRLSMDRDGREALYHKLLKTSSYFLVSGRPVACADAVPKGVPLFRRRIHLGIANMDDVVCISLRGITSTPKMISGLPMTLRQLKKARGLINPFGRVDHNDNEKRLPTIRSKRKF
jgi:hypothetical protein